MNMEVQEINEEGDYSSVEVFNVDLTHKTFINPLTHWRFSDPYLKGASATKRFARSRIFRCGCLKKYTLFFSKKIFTANT